MLKSIQRQRKNQVYGYIKKKGSSFDGPFLNLILFRTEYSFGLELQS